MQQDESENLESNSYAIAHKRHERTPFESTLFSNQTETVMTQLESPSLVSPKIKSAMDEFEKRIPSSHVKTSIEINVSPTKSLPIGSNEAVTVWIRSGCSVELAIDPQDGSFVHIIVEKNAKLSLHNLKTESNQELGSCHEHIHLSLEDHADCQIFFINTWNRSQHSQDLKVALLGNYASLTLTKIGFATRDHIHNFDINVKHDAHHTFSNQLIKTLSLHNGHQSFDGLIEVMVDANKTKARQINHNLLLSPDASIMAKPQLEIAHHDVRCSHGSTTSKPRPEEIFYCLSRGMTPVKVFELLSEGFLLHLITDHCPLQFQKELWNRISNELKGKGEKL